MRRRIAWLLGAVLLVLSIVLSNIWFNPSGQNPNCPKAVGYSLYRELPPGDISISPAGIAVIRVTLGPNGNIPIVARLLGIHPGWTNDTGDLASWVRAMLKGDSQVVSGDEIRITVNLEEIFKGEPCGPNDPEFYPDTSVPYSGQRGYSVNFALKPTPVTIALFVTALAVFALLAVRDFQPRHMQ